MLTLWRVINAITFTYTKTEVLVTGTPQQVAKFNNATADSPAFQFAGTSVSCSISIRVFGIIIDQHLAFEYHVTKLVLSCNYHIREKTHFQ